MSDKKKSPPFGEEICIGNPTTSSTIREESRAFFFFTAYYYMAVSHKDWELPNSRIWLAETDIESGLDFPI